MNTSKIASRKLWAQCPNRGSLDAEIWVGTPYRASHDDWACSIGISGLFSHLADQHGVDSWQALVLAQKLARTLLEDFLAEGGKLWEEPGGDEVDLAKLFGGGI